MEMTRRPVVMMVMVDALRHDYITPEDAPFLYSLGQSGRMGSLAPSFGFEPDAAYLAGMTPEEADGGAQFWLREGDCLFRAVGLFAALDRLPLPAWKRFVRKGVRAVAQATARDPLPRRMAAPAFIPFDQLARFSLSLKHMADDPQAMEGASLFDHARSLGLKVYFHGFPAHAVKTDVVLERYEREATGVHDLEFLFMGDLDGIGHAYGPESAERRAMLRRVDEALAKIYARACERHDGVDLIVFGDHGMAQVRGQVDVTPAIREAGLDVRRDSWFLDSTMARFWVADPVRRAKLVDALTRIRGGRVLGEGDRAKYHIRYPHNWFGDVIFAVDDHLVVHPCFYAESSPPQGMHGYLPGCRDNESAFVLGGRRIARLPPLESADMRRVFATVMSLLGAEPRPGRNFQSLAVA
jgi:predicted AlkP superfamily pyrophosphatase or phosphodiesterase